MELCQLLNFWNEDVNGNETDEETVELQFENEDTSFYTNELFDELEQEYEYYTFWNTEYLTLKN